MSLRAIIWAMDQRVGSITRKMVLLKLCDNANEESGECYPSVDTIAEVCECDRRTVQRHLRALEGSGVIRLTRQGGKIDGKYRSSRYRISGVDAGWPIKSKQGRQKVTPEIEGRQKVTHAGAAESHPCRGGSLPPEPVIEPVIKDKDMSKTADAVADAPPPAAKITSAKSAAVVAAWNEICGAAGLPTITASLWTGSASATNLAARWRAGPPFNSVEFWAALFEAVAADPLCSGQLDNRNGARPWRATLHWLVKRENFAKTYERLLSEAPA